MLELTSYEKKIIGAVLAEMRAENEDLKVKTDYAIIMDSLVSQVNLTKALNRIK